MTKLILENNGQTIPSLLLNLLVYTFFFFFFFSYPHFTYSRMRVRFKLMIFLMLIIQLYNKSQLNDVDLQFYTFTKTWKSTSSFMKNKQMSPYPPILWGFMHFSFQLNQEHVFSTWVHKSQLNKCRQNYWCTHAPKT